jgi:hypothetical protein
MHLRPVTVLTLLLTAALLLGCKAAEKLTSTNSANTNTETARTASPSPAQGSDDDIVPSGTGVEKEKPAAGKANVQGKAFYNEKPAAGVEVKLCKTFNRFFGGCGGDTFTAKTDEAGEYLIKNVPPGTYEGLTVRVFNTPYYVFATSGVISAAKYEIESDKTYFAPDSHLFKNDLKLQSPKAGAKVAADGVEVKWDAYPDAAYYKLSLFADSTTTAEAPYDFIGKRVDDVSIVVDKPLKPGTYNVKVEAYNANERKLAQTSDDMKFSVK